MLFWLTVWCLRRVHGHIWASQNGSPLINFLKVGCEDSEEEILIITLAETHNIGVEIRIDREVILSGCDKHYAVVEMITWKPAKAALLSHECFCDHMVLACFELNGPGLLVVVTVYAPTSSASNKGIDEFYDQTRTSWTIFANMMHAMLSLNLTARHLKLCICMNRTRHRERT